MKMCCKYTTAIILLSLTLLAVGSVNTRLQKLIIDTDGGIDDVIAILMLLRTENAWRGSDFKIVAITTGYGVTSEKNAQCNVLKALTIANRTDIPVYSGAKKPLLKNHTSSFFGEDGLGDADFPKQVAGHIDDSMPAAVAMTKLATKYSGEISLLTLGSLTNIATAIALNDSFLNNFDELVILGSSVAGVGNVGPNVEYNFDLDPESNFMVLNSSTQLLATLFPWETVLASPITRDWRINVLGKQNSSIIQFLNIIEKKILGDSTTWNRADAMAAAVLLYPELITKSIETNVSPVVHGEARGSVLVDYSNYTGKSKNARIVQGFNVTAYQQILIEALS